MFLTDRKLERRISELQEYRYRDVKHLERFAVAEETQGVVNPKLPESFEGWDELCVGTEKLKFLQSGQERKFLEFSIMVIQAQEITLVLNPCSI